MNLVARRGFSVPWRLIAGYPFMECQDEWDSSQLSVTYFAVNIWPLIGQICNDQRALVDL